jgi:predicted dehydrogenase
MFLIVGTGLIAEEYIKCLINLKCNFEIVGNSKEKCNYILNKYNKNCYNGGIENFNFEKKYENIIIATPIKLLFSHLKICIIKCKDLKNIFIEKPGCLYTYQINEIIKIKCDINIYIAYNRRFYSSVIKGKEIIKNDKIKKLNLCINEYKLNKIQKLVEKELIQNYFTGMTTHVVDLAFFLTGIPNILNVLNIDGYGDLEYHKRGCFFNGNGITKNGIEFEYNGDWSESGKWKIELYLESGKILSYQPLEDLKIINNDGSEEIIKRSQIDIDFKPGYYYQVKSFISDKKDLLNIESHYDNLQVFHKMVGYNPHYNILLVGCGNIGFRHLQGFINTNLPLNLFIVEINDDNINRAQDYIKDFDNINVHFYKDLKKIKNDYFDICTIATCSDIRLILIKNIIENNNIKYISNMILEKVTFQSLKQFEEYEKLIKKFKNCNTFITSIWKQIYDNDKFDLFKNPKISITGGRWGLLCNSVHALIFISHFKSNFSLNLDQDYKIIESKRANFKEMYGKLYNEDINISSNDNSDKINITFTENNKKLIIKVSNVINFYYYENNILISEFTKDNSYFSSLIQKEYENLLLHKNTILCSHDRGYKAHKCLFECISNVFDTKLLPIT